MQLDLCGEGDDEHLTYSNLFINNNYPRFMQEMLPVICEKEIVFVANEAAKFDELPLKIIKHFPVGTNCIINDYHLVEEIKNWIKSNNIENTIFLFSASTLSNYIIHECFKEHSNNTYLDVGTCLSPWMGLEGWKHSRAYLQHWILKEQQEVYMEKHSLNYFVCLLYGSPVGYIGVVDGDIRFCTDPDFQRMGIGTFMLLKIKDKYPEAYGQIKKENKSSQHVFDKCDVDYKVI